MLGQPAEIRRQPLRTDVVCALGDDPQSIVHFWSVGTTPLSATRLAHQTALHQPDQALAMQLGDSLHLVQEMASFLAVGLKVTLLHLSEILASLVNRHSVFDGHRPLGNIFI